MKPATRIETRAKTKKPSALPALAEGRYLSERSASVRYGVTLLLILTATGVTGWLHTFIGPQLFFPPFTAAVVVAAWLVGLGPAMLATAAGVFVNFWFFIEPRYSFAAPDPADTVRLLLFLIVGVGVGLIVHGRNQSARRYAEQREWWRVALMSIGDAVIVTDGEARVSFMNRVSETLTGWSLEEAAGRSLSDVFRVVNEVTRERVDDPVARVIRAGLVVGLANHTLLVRRDGTEVPIDDSAAPVYDNRGNLVGVILVYRDITAARAAQTALLRHAERLRLQAELLDHAYDAVFVRDETERVTYWNPACEQLYGWTAREVLSMDAHELLHTRFPVSLDAVTQTLRREGHWSGELVHTTRAGREITVDSRQVLVSSDDTDRARILEINRDVTEQKRNREREAELLAQAQEASRLKDEFLATLSHELRTPLNAILGWTQMLLGGKLEPAAVQRAYVTIDRNAQVQRQLITDILDMSRIITGKLRLNVEVVDLVDIVQGALDSLRVAAEAKRLEMTTTCETAEARILGDRDRLQQVFWNLLSNAVKFTPAGGRIEVSVAVEDSRYVARVTDSGIGIPREFLPHVFERFTQLDASASRAYGGLGLGLAISRHLVELHGGSIQADSAGQGQGATFTVALPVREWVPGTPRRPATENVVPEPGALGPSLAGISVLVVDDESDTRDLLFAALSQQGADVLLSASAAEALVVLKRHRPDVLISDIGMPAEDGYVFIGKVRALAADAGGETPAIALTAYARNEDRARALAAGYDQYLAKPVTPAELIAMIDGLARRRRVTAD